MDRPDDILGALDDEQRQVATSLGGPVAVIAGAGTGKTRAITHRIAHGARTGDMDPRAVLAVTFTTRAAGEMRGRLHSLGVGQVQARTFHSAALRQVQYFWPRAYGTDLPQVTEGRMGLVAEAAQQQRLRVDTALLRDLLAEVSWAKVSNVTAGEYPALARAAGRQVNGVPAEQVAKIFTGYEAAKRNRGQIDFDDILLCAAALLSEHDDIAREIREQYRHFVVDEYQDVSPLQQSLLDLWLGGRDDVCVVGDPHQSIHAFAGARSSFLTTFAQTHPGTTIVRLVRDYRSTPQVVDLANKVIAPRRTASSPPAPALGGVRLVAQQPPGPDVEFASHAEEPDEARAVAQWLQSVANEGVPWREMAVLFRINAQSPALEAALSQAGIPYMVRGSERFYERTEIKQALAQLRSATRAEPEGPALPLVKDVLSGLGWAEEPPEGQGKVRERWESLNALVDLAHDVGVEDPARDFSQVVAELFERASRQQAPVNQGVTLATMHAAKGLEWEAVSLFGVAEGTLPFVLATSEEQLAEEQRLLYVGVTRARSRLRISWSRTRSGGRGARGPSRFLDGLTPAAVAAQAQRERGRGRTSRRSAQEQVCRVCGRSLTNGAERKLGRHEGCPSDYDEALFARLKAWRKKAADASSVPAFVVFTDATLLAIAESEPASESQLLAVSGVGRTKYERYGADVLSIIGGEDPGDEILL